MLTMSSNQYLYTKRDINSHEFTKKIKEIHIRKSARLINTYPKITRTATLIFLTEYNHMKMLSDYENSRISIRTFTINNNYYYNIDLTIRNIFEIMFDKEQSNRIIMFEPSVTIGDDDGKNAYIDNTTSSMDINIYSKSDNIDNVVMEILTLIHRKFNELCPDIDV